MIDLIIRKAKEEDCKILSIIKQKVWLTTYRGIYDDSDLDNYDYLYHENKFKSKLDELYVLENDNKLIGYFSFGIPRHKYLDYTHCINSLYILKEYQGNGIGRKVFEYINNYFLDNIIEKYIVNCNKYNDKALGFYLKMGGIITNLDDTSDSKAAHQFYIENKRR